MANLPPGSLDSSPRNLTNSYLADHTCAALTIKQVAKADSCFNFYKNQQLLHDFIHKALLFVSFFNALTVATKLINASSDNTRMPFSIWVTDNFSSMYAINYIASHTILYWPAACLR
jgi:hypothetical protein